MAYKQKYTGVFPTLPPHGKSNYLKKGDKGIAVKELQLLADGLYKNYGGIKGAFSPVNDNSLSFAICGKENELNGLFADFKSQFQVRGGGRNGMVQGTVTANIDEIKSYFQKI